MTIAGCYGFYGHFANDPVDQAVYREAYDL
jgi:hypothetical protein